MIGRSRVEPTTFHKCLAVHLHFAQQGTGVKPMKALFYFGLLIFVVGFVGTFTAAIIFSLSGAAP